MVSLFISCEGQTEEMFVKRILADHLLSYGVYVTPVVLHTSRSSTGVAKKGGGNSYAKVRDAVLNLCRNSHAFVTTMYDYYKFPSINGKSDWQSADELEQRLSGDINRSNFHPNILQYEFEGLLFSDIRAFSVCNIPEKSISALELECAGVFNTIVAPAENRSFANSPCILCGQCVSVCPTGALMEVSEIDKVDEAMKAGKYVVVQTAPAVRAALGEEFDMPIGTLVTGKMVAALKRLGFKKVFDTNFAADLTIMEEATELLDRIQNGGKLPMITSCSPGWVNYAEYNYGDLLPHLSSCKSPHQMFGAILKSYYCEKNGIDPKDMFVVSIMPCTAKKSEKERPELSVNGLKDVDAVLTTRELAKLIKRSGINFVKLPDAEFDNDIVGDYTGAGVIFGTTGGVMEAALRTAAYKLTGEELGKAELKEVRGFEGIKTASYTLGGKEIKVAVAHGMKNAKVLLDEIREGKSEYHFIEIMGCPGGCIAGGGQPFVKPCFLPNEGSDILDTFKAKRAAALYQEDESKALRASHKNPQIIALYEQYLGKPNSHKAHELLHTTYAAKEKFKD